MLTVNHPDGVRDAPSVVDDRESTSSCPTVKTRLPLNLFRGRQTIDKPRSVFDLRKMK
jgi:hypothetical protein